MTRTVAVLTGNYDRFERISRRTSVTPHATTTALHSNMDQKELEDRMAAAEALSSLGLPTDFRTSEPQAQSMTVEIQPSVAKNEKPTRGRGRGRSKEKGEARDTGRETKSRSTRGRGRAKDTQLSATRNVPAHPPTALSVPAVQGDHLFVQQQLQQSAPSAPSQPKRRNTGGGRRGKQGAQLSVTITKDGGTNVTCTQNADGSLHHGPHDPGSFSTQSTASSFVRSAAVGGIPVEARNGGLVYSSTVSTTVAPNLPAAGKMSPGASGPLTLPTFSGARRAPTTPTDGLPSQPVLKSLASLPSLSLGSTGLPNLQSIPNLPSLPNAIAALQLSAAGVPDVASLSREDGAGLDSQLSPHSRDSGEKSLPLKKRKIFDSSSVATPSPTTVTRPSFPTSVPSSPLVSGPSTSAPTLTPGPGQQERQLEVSSPGPTPVHLLSQVLPPAVSMQLLSEINTAITPDEDGDLPLHIAVVHENEAMVRKLIQLMALASRQVDRFNKQQQTPLHLAVKLAYLPAIQMLLEAGGNPNLVDSSGLTSIHMAVQGRDIDCLEALLQWSKFQLDLNYRNFEGLAPLHTAVINNDMEIVRTLLDHGSDINIMDGKSGRTALFHAAEGNQKAAVELLLRHGADPEIANYAGVIPAMAAQGRSHTFISRLLTRAVDEGPDEMVLATTGTEEMEVNSPSAMEVAVSDESSDSSRVSVTDKIRNSMAGGNQQPALVRSVSRTQPQPQPVSMPASHGVSMATSQAAPFSRQNSQGSSSMVSGGVSAVSFVRTFSNPAPATAVPSTISGSEPLNKPPADRVSEDSDPTAENSMTGSESSDSAAASTTQAAIQQTMARLLVQNLMMRAKAERRDETQIKTSTPQLLTPPSKPAAAFAAAGFEGGGVSLATSMPSSLSERGHISSTSVSAAASLAASLPNTFGITCVASASVAASLSQPVSVPSSSVSFVRVSNSNVARLVSLPAGVTTVASVPNLPSPAFSSSSVSSNVTETKVSSLPAPAHTQPTRPLLLFRSTSVDPRSGDGRRMESVELRHVTEDDFRALQQSSTNSVNPANQRLRPLDPNLRSAPPDFEKLRAFLTSPQASMLRPNIPLSLSSTPPVANHASVESLHKMKTFYSPSDSSDEPTDLSLKPRKPAAVKTEPEPAPKVSVPDSRTVMQPFPESMLGKGTLPPGVKVFIAPPAQRNSVSPQQNQQMANVEPAKPKAKRTRTSKPRAPKGKKDAAEGKETGSVNLEKTGSVENMEMDSNTVTAVSSFGRTVPVGNRATKTVPDSPRVKGKGLSVSEETSSVTTAAVLESTKLALQVKINQGSEPKPTAPLLNMPTFEVEEKQKPPLSFSFAQGRQSSVEKGQITPSISSQEMKRLIEKGQATVTTQGMQIPGEENRKQTALSLSNQRSQPDEVKGQTGMSASQGLSLSGNKGQTVTSPRSAQSQLNISSAPKSPADSHRTLSFSSSSPMSQGNKAMFVDGKEPSNQDGSKSATKQVPHAQSFTASVTCTKTTPSERQTLHMTSKPVHPCTSAVTSTQSASKPVTSFSTTAPSNVGRSGGKGVNEPEEVTMPILKAEVDLPPSRESFGAASEECPVLDSEASMDEGRPATPDSPALVIDTEAGSGDSQSEQPMETG